MTCRKIQKNDWRTMNLTDSSGNRLKWMRIVFKIFTLIELLIV